MNEAVRLPAPSALIAGATARRVTTAAPPMRRRLTGLVRRGLFMGVLKGLRDPACADGRVRTIHANGSARLWSRPDYTAWRRLDVAPLYRRDGRHSAKLGCVTEGVAPRRRSTKRWLLVVALGLVGLLAILIGVALLADDDTAPCGCSPIPSPTASSSAE